MLELNGRLDYKDPYYYIFNSDLKDSNILRIWSQAMGYSCAASVATNQNLYGHLKVTKINSNYKDVDSRVNGAKYILYDENQKGYVDASYSTANGCYLANWANYTTSTKVMRYINRTDAISKAFVTGYGNLEQGCIEIDKLDASHKYTLIEVSAPDGYKLAADKTGIVVRSYARNDQYRLDYLFQAFKDMFYQDMTKDATVKPNIIYALTGKTNVNSNYKATTKNGLINEILFYKKEKTGNNKTYDTLKKNLDSKSSSDLKTYLRTIYNRYQSKTTTNWKDVTNDYGDITRFYSKLGGYTSTSVTEPLTGDLRIIKVSAENDQSIEHDKILSGATFIIRKSGTSQYVDAASNNTYTVKRNDDGTMKTANVKNATRFTCTDNYKIINISGLDIGQYDIIEIKQPYEYTINGGGTVEQIDVDGDGKKENVQIYSNQTVAGKFRDTYENYVGKTLSSFIPDSMSIPYALAGIGEPTDPINLTNSTILSYLENHILDFYNNNKTGISFNRLMMPTTNEAIVRKYIAEVLNRVKNTDRYNENCGTVYSYYCRMCGYTSVRVKNISGRGNLLIKKVDEDTERPLNGVGFIVKCIDIIDGYDQTGEGKYIKVQNNIPVYSAEKQTFITNENGIIEIKSLLPGTYELEEISVGNGIDKYIYTPGNKYTIIVKEGKTTTNGNEDKVENPQFYGAIKIKKVDEQTQIALEGIGFKLYATNMNTSTNEPKYPDGWLLFENNNETGNLDLVGTTTNFNDVKEIFTDANGLTKIIEKIPLTAKITVYETSLPEGLDKIYELDEGGNGSPVPATAKGSKVNEEPVSPKKISQEDIRNGKIATVIPYEMTNKQDYISLSGYVWEDMPGFYGSKESQRNDIYDLNNNSVDYLINGIRVVIKDKNGNVVTNGDDKKCETTTNNVNGKNGFYRFEKVYIDKLSDYYVEFEYDGIVYQNVLIDNINNNESSKAKETNADRNKFNNEFSEITGKGQTVKNLNGENIELKYKKQEDKTVILSNSFKKSKENKIIKIEDNGDLYNNGYTSYPISATTNEAGLDLKDKYEELKNNNTKIVTEIENINLGLYEREKPDLRVEKDVFQADVGINGQNFIYKYNANLLETGYDTTIGVQFQNSRTEKYKLPIYRADAKYESEDKGLNINIVYKIALVNESTNLYTKVNSIDEYFSKDYVLSKVYAGNVDGYNGENGKEITGEVKIEEISKGNSQEYKAYRISGLNMNIAPLKGQDKNVKYLYLEFDLPKTSYYDNKAQNKIVEKELKNIVEISSYSVYSDKDCTKLYGGVDKDSIPRNLDASSDDSIEKDTNYEDDTNKALGLNIVDAGERTINGIVFEDSTTVNANRERLGNGKYDNSERKISNVEVKLVDQEKTIDSKYIPDVVKSNDGTYSISGFIPGKYKLIFTWGADGKGISTDENANTIVYTVNDYKGTIWTNERQKIVGDYWYKENVDTRYTDAKDDWTQRLDSDKKSETSEPMPSSTDQFNIGIELFSTDSYSTDELDNFIKEGKYKYTIDNIDFGLAERPKQILNIEKVVDKIKITLDNGQTVLDSEIDHNTGKFKNEQNIKFATYTPISEANPYGLIKYETDQYPLHIAVHYKIALTNDGELDYNDKDYYLYGKLPNEKDKEGKVVKVKASKIYDYLEDADFSSAIFEDEDISKNQEKVKEITYEEYGKDLQNLGITTTITENFYSDKTIDENGNIIYKSGWEKSAQKIDYIFNEWWNNGAKKETVRTIKLSDKKILDLKALAKDDLKPGEKREIEIVGEKTASSPMDNIEIKNDVEIAEVELKNNYGRKPSPSYTKVYDRGEIVTVTPPTGENKDYTLPVIITIITMTILGIGIIIIKKKVLR